MNMNDTRAEWADKAVAQFRNSMNPSEDEALRDLLCNLMHWSHTKGIDFTVILQDARAAFNEERKAGYETQR